MNSFRPFVFLLITFPGVIAIFLTIPEAEIPDTQVLMTVVGGKTIHLISSLASEIGMQPVGATTWTEPIPDGWRVQ